GGRPNADDSLQFGAARVGRIDRSVGRSPCARRSDRPKRRAVALRASVGSTEASGKSLRGSMPSVRLSPSTRERVRPLPTGGLRILNLEFGIFNPILSLTLTRSSPIVPLGRLFSLSK